jgi:cytochrome c oxidase assembly factor CtaG
MVVVPMLMVMSVPVMVMLTTVHERGVKLRVQTWFDCHSRCFNPVNIECVCFGWLRH